MAPRAKIVAIAGSTRTGSLNKKLMRFAAQAARAAGAEVTEVDLRDYVMPLYDGDLEAESGLPPTARALKKLFQEHNGLLIVSPEYNASISGVLKNALDWISRTDTPGEPALSAFDGKVAAIMSASPGALGGIRGLVPLRAMLSEIKVMVLPSQLALSAAGEAFDDSGKLKDPKRADSVNSIVKALVSTIERLNQ